MATNEIKTLIMEANRAPQCLMYFSFHVALAAPPTAACATFYRTSLNAILPLHTLNKTEKKKNGDITKIQKCNGILLYQWETSFEAAALEYTTAIGSLEELLKHAESYGDGDGVDKLVGDGGRGRLAPLYWSRAAAHIMIGRYRSAVNDCKLALKSEPQWAQV